MTYFEYLKVEDKVKEDIGGDREDEENRIIERVYSCWEVAVGQLRARAEREGQSAFDYEGALRQVYDLLINLDNAVHAYLDHQSRVVWGHQKFNILTAGEESRGIAISRQELIDTAATYLGQLKLRTDYLDWLFIDALLFAEVDGFARILMLGPPLGPMNWAFVFAGGSEVKYYLFMLLFKPLGFLARYAAAPALAIWLYLHQHETSAAWTAGAFALYLALKVLSIPALIQRWRSRKKAIRLLELMVAAYELAAPPVLNPGRLKTAVDEATAQGAVFPRPRFL